MVGGGGVVRGGGGGEGVVVDFAPGTTRKRTILYSLKDHKHQATQNPPPSSQTHMSHSLNS